MSNKKNCCDEVEKYKVDAKREVGNRLTEIREKRNLTQLGAVDKVSHQPSRYAIIRKKSEVMGCSWRCTW